MRYNKIINGMCRSGNHAITFWMIHNLVDEVLEIEKGVYRDKDYRVLYLNNVGRKPKEYGHVISSLLESYQYIIRSYEDSYYTRDTKIIILRDFINMLCSRYKKYGPNLALNNSYVSHINQLISMWKQHATGRPQKIVLYNKWLIDKEYRDYIGQRSDIPNIKDNYTYISDIGEGSSFGNNKNYLNRYKEIILPKYMIDYILMDRQLISLNKTLFNVNIEDMLNDHSSSI